MRSGVRSDFNGNTDSYNNAAYRNNSANMSHAEQPYRNISNNYNEPSYQSAVKKSKKKGINPVLLSDKIAMISAPPMPAINTSSISDGTP